MPGARLALACHNNADVAAPQIVEAPNVHRVASCDQQGETSVPGENPRLGFDVRSDVPALDGYTDTVPDIVGRLGARISLAIFTEGNHFPALLGGQIIEPFRAWARTQTRYAGLALDNPVAQGLGRQSAVSRPRRRRSWIDQSLKHQRDSLTAAPAPERPSSSI